jgi:hypothetical protein
MKGGSAVLMNAYEVHQRELLKRIRQIRDGDPDKKWTDKELAIELGIPVESPGFQRVREVLAQERLAQTQERRRISIGFR